MFDLFKSKSKRLQDKVERYISLENDWKQLQKDIDEAAKEYQLRKSESTTNDFSPIIAEAIKKRFKEFEQQHIKNIGRLKHKHDEINKSLSSLVGDDVEFATLVEDEKSVRKQKTILTKYRSGVIELSQCDSLLKAISKEKIKYADNIVRNEKGEILLLKRSELDDSKPGYFTIPGGHVDPGENCEEAAKRELEEEAGIKVEKVNKVGEFEDSKVKIEYFESWVENVEPVLQEEEIWSYEWVKPEDLKNYQLPFNMGENLDKILFPNKAMVVKINKSFEDNLISKKQRDSLLKIILKKEISKSKYNTILGEYGDQIIDKLKSVMATDPKYADKLKKLKERRDPENIEEDFQIEKAWQPAQIGEIRTRGDGKKFRKVANTGDSKKDWQLVTESKNKEGEGDKGKNAKQSEESLSKDAQNTSETALQNAIKQSDDPKIREAAHQELDRRDKEEKPQEEEKEKESQKKENTTFKIKEEKYPESTSVIIGNPDGSRVRGILSKDGKTFQIKSTFVKEDERGKGMAKSMYKQLLNHLEKKGVTTINSDVQVEENAGKIYNSLKNEGYDIKQNEGAELEKDPSGNFWWVPSDDTKSPFTINLKTKINKSEEESLVKKDYTKWL